MKIAFLETWTGLSGDMWVGAFLDAGWPEARLHEIVSALALPSVEVAIERRVHRGLSGLGIRVHAPEDAPHRGLTEIEAILRAAPLPDRARELALATFRRLGEVEARIHAVPIDAVHFHEIGAADSIIDIVAATCAVVDLGIECVLAGPLPLSEGEVLMDHGRLPVPAPATSLLLAGWPVRPVEATGEFLTPTAAALLSVLARPVSGFPNLSVLAVGFGAGTRSHPLYPNLLRLWIGESGDVFPAALRGSGHTASVAGSHIVRLVGDDSGEPAHSHVHPHPHPHPDPHAQGSHRTDPPTHAHTHQPRAEVEERPANATVNSARVRGWRLRKILVLETQLDDMDPRFVAALTEDLLLSGALEVYRTAVAMKKGRNGVQITVLCEPATEVGLTALLFEGSTTLGVRRREEDRMELERELSTVETPWGRVRVKRSPGGPPRAEYEDLRRISLETGTPLLGLARVMEEWLGRADGGVSDHVMD